MGRIRDNTFTTKGFVRLNLDVAGLWKEWEGKVEEKGLRELGQRYGAIEILNSDCFWLRMWKQLRASLWAPERPSPETAALK